MSVETQTETVSTGGPARRRPNRRGVAAREKLLKTALEMLATGQPEAVSINLVAKEAGLSWGSVQNLFGDSDGFWSTVVELIVDAAPEIWVKSDDPTIAGRVEEVATLYRQILETPHAVAVETIRAALPRPLDHLAESHPKTAASISHLDEMWAKAFINFFSGLDVDAQRARDAADLLASALRGLRADKLNGTKIDLDRAHRTLIEAVTAYLAA